MITKDPIELARIAKELVFLLRNCEIDIMYDLHVCPYEEEKKKDDD